MVRKFYFVLLFVVTPAVLLLAHYWPGVLWVFLLFGPYLLLGMYDLLQRKHSLLRVYPVVGHVRYWLESIRGEIQQYFIESDIDGRPFSRETRSVVYQRAKQQRDTRPFGTQHDVDRVGYEWLNHSLCARHPLQEEPRVLVGDVNCSNPYQASHLNISAMSYGALSRNAVMALNRGARIGGFAHNTGEGGLSDWHRQGGDLIWQVGTGYFGCRTPEGNFDADKFTEKSRWPEVRMIEIKLSQGAKPGHGGILPAAKVTAEIAAIRHVPMGQDVISPPTHSAFSNPTELLQFVDRLRKLSGGKPVGFKLCVGYKAEFLSICKAMLETGLTPDFITVDGSEGGTGAAPLEFTNSVGMAMRDGLSFVHNALTGVGLRDKMRIIASGKIMTAFHLFRTLALGADMCNSARGMMFALGCLQSLRCNTNECPTGVATQDAKRYRGLDVDLKAQRVAEHHASTIESLLELTAAAGLGSPHQIGPQHVLRRVDLLHQQTFARIYQMIPEGCLLDDAQRPEEWEDDWDRASTQRF